MINGKIYAMNSDGSWELLVITSLKEDGENPEAQLLTAVQAFQQVYFDRKEPVPKFRAVMPKSMQMDMRFRLVDGEYRKVKV